MICLRQFPRDSASTIRESAYERHSMVNSYDEVAYPSSIYAHTHPDGLAVLATLSGMEPAPVPRCRVLELGCGDGFNLISMAYGLPESRFLGIDLAAAPIARGSAAIDKLQLKNISLRVQDIAAAGAEIGEFDYIIAHGLYSWVPAPVREKIMELCGRCLSAQGVAFISYNAYPGNHVRDITRNLIHYHVANFSDPRQQIRQARAFLKLAAEAADPADLYRQILVREEHRLGKQADDFFFHDDLNPYNQPFYFHEFMAEAHRHGLQFLGEAEIGEKREREYPPHVEAALAQIDPDDVIAAEQYRDFLCGRTFRRTLLCRQDIALDRALDSAHIVRLFLAGEIRTESQNAGEGADAVEVFRGPSGSEFETDQPLVKAALRRIGAASPAGIHFPDLLAAARQDAQCGGEIAADAADLASAMLQLAIAGGVELHTCQPRFVVEPGLCPAASAFARLQAEGGPRVSTMFHRVVNVDSALSRLLLHLLDGTHDRAGILDALREAIRRGKTEMPASSADVITQAEVDDALRRLARLALLIS